MSLQEGLPLESLGTSPGEPNVRLVRVDGIGTTLKISANPLKFFPSGETPGEEVDP